MNYLNSISSLDLLATPVIICTSAGLVIYKNYAAMNNIRLPRRNTHIQFHLDRGGLSEYENIPSRKKPSVISVDTGDRRANAFVMPYRRGTQLCSLWVFFSLIQINALSKIFSDYERDLYDIGYEICDIIRCIDEKSTTLDEKIHAEADNRIEKRVEKALDYMLVGGEVRQSSVYTCESAVNLLSHVTERSFNQVGYDVRLSSVENSKYSNLVDLHGFLMLYLYITAFAARLSSDGRVDISLSETQLGMNMKLTFTLGYTHITMSGENDISKLALFAPKYALDLMIISRICKNHMYTCTCDVGEEPRDNVRLSVDLPACKAYTLHAASGNTTEIMLLERDIQAAIYYMFLDTAAQSEI